MEETAIISTAMKMHHITNLNTYLLDSKGDFILHHESLSIPSFMPGANEADVRYLNEKMNSKRNQLFSYTNQWGLNYLGYQFVEQDTYRIIIGPYMTVTPNYFSLIRDLHLSSGESEDLRVVCNQIQVLTPEKASSFSSVLQNFEHILEKNTAPIIIESVNSREKSSQKDIGHTTDEDSEIIKLRYKIENDLMHAVEMGDKNTALELIHSNDILFSFSERFPNQPMVRVRNLAIVLNTLLRAAVKNSNVPFLLIHRISEKYAYKIEYTNQLVKLHQLYDEMIKEYCDLVIKNSLKKYSKDIQKVIEQLISSYDRQIDKNELATLTFTHPSHLSRKFKQETGMTFTGYQQMLRMNKAKHLLESEILPIEEIAWLVGYDDSSYFTRVFKKETGTTPTQYRERN